LDSPLIQITLIKNTSGGWKSDLKAYSMPPEFPKGLEWINTPRPPTIESLPGKIVYSNSGRTAELTASKARAANYIVFQLTFSTNVLGIIKERLSKRLREEELDLRYVLWKRAGQAGVVD
jgi:hypothetical protein